MDRNRGGIAIGIAVFVMADVFLTVSLPQGAPDRGLILF